MITTNLSQYLVILKVSGPDSSKFLQGQLTNDITLLTPQIKDNCITYQFAAHLNHKGRIIANFIIINPEIDTYYLITNRELVDTILPRLKMFILRSKVVISEEQRHIIFTNSNDHVNASNFNIRLANNHLLTITDKDFSNNINIQHWNQFLVNHGITLIHKETTEQFIPQQINLDDLNGISFTKGCYTGQEIVARTHYLGKIKRRLYKFTLSQDKFANVDTGNPETTIEQTPHVGQVIVSPNMNNQEVGIIAELANENGQITGIASIQIDCINQAFLSLNHFMCPLQIIT